MTHTNSPLARRSFLQAGAALAGVAVVSGFEALAARSTGAAPPDGGGGSDYGPLAPVPDGTTGETLISLPPGFRYVSFGRTGDPMDDGIPTPGSHDGMAAFGVGRFVDIVRNHERGAGPAFATGMTYDPAAGGGTTTLRFDRLRGGLVGARASLPALFATAPVARRRGVRGCHAKRRPTSSAVFATGTSSTSPPGARATVGRSPGSGGSRMRPSPSIPVPASCTSPRTRRPPASTGSCRAATASSTAAVDSRC